MGLIVLTLVGGSLSAGAANTFNMVYDRDIDAKMGRTLGRPLVTGEATPRGAMIFGLVLTLVSTLWLGLLVNWLSAALALAANVFYVVGYTMILKRRTRQNIVWGGAAGCFPALIGWTAVTGSLAWAPVVLFMVVFFWNTPRGIGEWRTPSMIVATGGPPSTIRWSLPSLTIMCRPII